MLAAGASLFVITRGSRGAQAWHREAGAIEVAAPAVMVVDAIGAAPSGRTVVRAAGDRANSTKLTCAVNRHRATWRTVICFRLRGVYLRQGWRRSAALHRCRHQIDCAAPHKHASQFLVNSIPALTLRPHDWQLGPRFLNNTRTLHTTVRRTALGHRFTIGTTRNLSPAHPNPGRGNHTTKANS